MHSFLRKAGYVLANMVVMVILHGNSKQFWPKIPYLSLRNEGTPEHMRLLLHTTTIVTAGEALIGQMPRERWLPRAIVLGLIPASLPLLLFFGQKVLRLQGQAAEVYNLALVPILPIASTLLEDAITGSLAAIDHAPEDQADYSHLV
ncbi:hypothetical protein [Candidatus Chloroploca asiatica]|uniref:Uncharacterized protein n=1 Tax=Candidatus Chloroploca asiatica TaxID=1506545 RepID=A0A2H3KRB0_9CHLR|nr:hypothetical protein [Candidatus Chloroploca asiatica]PDW00075.1 hypothetical protein A9Q02_10740 [Candidatus Chloroploca asiatica]